MKVTIQYQESYSRGQLLLRSFFGFFYIAIPHAIGLYLYSIYLYIMMLYAFVMVLVNQTYPKAAFDAYTGYLRWSLRLNASLMNLVDGYPPFGPGTRWEKADFEVGYPEVVTRKRMLFAIFLSAIFVIPQIIVIYVRYIIAYVFVFIAFFAVLFTGKYPEGMHKFVVETYRITYRVSLYTAALYFKYPEFSGEETEVDKMHA